MKRIGAEIKFMPNAMSARFIGALIPEGVVTPYIQELRFRLGDDVEPLISCHHARYGDSHHVTLINPLELPNIDPSLIEGVIGQKVFIDLVGLGEVKSLHNDYKSYFIVCYSKEMLALRRRLTATVHDFHVTLGFKDVDLHGVPKGMSTLLKRVGKIQN